MKIFILAFSVFFMSTAGYAGSPKNLNVSGSCTPKEKWSGQGNLPENVLDNLTDMLAGDIAPALGLARAYDLEKNKSSEARLLGYYMEGRALLMSGLEDTAMEGLTYAATSGSTSPTGNEIQFAAMQCITHILRANPGMPVPATIASNLKSLAALATTPARRQIPSELALDILLDRISQDQTGYDEVLGALSGTGAYENVARGMIAAQKRDHLQVIAHLSPILPANKHANLPEGLKSEETRARLTLARAYYATQQFDEAIAQYQRIDHRSNEISEVLSELGWSYIQLKRYGDAVGIAVNLRLGEMRGTFTPESLEVASMSLNELCQFQESLRTVKTLEHDYEPSYAWLKNKATSNSGPSLYTLAINYLKGNAGDVPAKVAGEWIRAPLFLSGQSEIHRLFGVKEHYNNLINSMKDALGSAKTADQEPIRQAVLLLQQHQSNTLEAADKTRTQWVDRINAELTRRDARMLAELEDVRENSRMVKIEIYNGASHDMIWRRAHPEFKESDTKFLSEKNSPSGSAVWNWGKVDLNADHAEVWEDELGAFRAHLQDHCSDKDRYLGVSTPPTK
jgi:tetratricopeptide (TPR) repeat protein